MVFQDRGYFEYPIDKGLGVLRHPAVSLLLRPAGGFIDVWPRTTPTARPDACRAFVRLELAPLELFDQIVKRFHF